MEAATMNEPLEHTGPVFKKASEPEQAQQNESIAPPKNKPLTKTQIAAMEREQRKREKQQRAEQKQQSQMFTDMLQADLNSSRDSSDFQTKTKKKSKAKQPQVYYAEQDQFNDEGRLDIINIYNGYKIAYEGKIDHAFLTVDRMYSLPTQAIENDLNVVRQKKNNFMAPDLLGRGLLILVSLLEKAVNDMNFEKIILGGAKKVSFSAEVEIQFKEGFFNDELEQISIEYGKYFTTRPEYRLLGKLATIGHNVNTINKTPNQAATFVPPANQRQSAKKLATAYGLDEE